MNTVRANFTGWRDHLYAALILLVVLTVGRSWFGDQPWKIAAWTACGVGVSAGLGVDRLVAARIAFHSFDGLLAADAIQPSLRRHYVVAWHRIGIATLTAITLVVRPSLLVISVPAYLTGVFVAGLAARLARERAASGKAAIGWNIRRWLHRPVAGVAAAMIVLVSLLSAHSMGTTGLLALVGLEAVLFALVLTPVEHDIVRFKAISGYSPWLIVIGHAVGLLLFAGITVTFLWFALGPVPAGIVLAASAAVLLLLAMRVLAYCVHDKRFADLLISIFAGLLILVGYSMLALLPFLVAAVLWQLQRRAAEKTWLLT